MIQRVVARIVKRKKARTLFGAPGQVNNRETSKKAGSAGAHRPSGRSLRWPLGCGWLLNHLSSRNAGARVDRTGGQSRGLFVPAIDLGIRHVAGDLCLCRLGRSLDDCHTCCRQQPQDKVRPLEPEPDRRRGDSQKDAAAAPQCPLQGVLTCSGVTVPTPGVELITAVPPNRL